jgi:hypothetical protein
VTAVPPEILLAAREAVAAEAIYRLDAVPAGQIVRIAVEAAAPLIAAAERERIRQLAEHHGVIVTIGPITAATYVPFADLITRAVP